jgi:hypothetical protein
MNVKIFLTLSLLAASFNAQSAVTTCPSGWTKSADWLTCVLETKTTQTPNQASNTAKPVCISGYAYSSASMKCEQNTIASQFTKYKAYAYMSDLRFGPNPQEEDKCLNFAGYQASQPANSYQSGGGNCACNSGYVYNGLADGSAGCNVASYNGCVHDSNYSFKCNDTSTSKCNNQNSITFYHYGYICGLYLPNQVRQPITFSLGVNFDSNFESSEYGPEPGNCLGYYTNIKGSCDSTNSICSYDISFKSHSGDTILSTDRICVQLK